MLRLSKIINKTLSIRLSLMVVSSMALLLMASLIVMLYYSRKAVKDETLQMASQTLEGAVLRIDNLLLSVEQTAGNYYFSLLPHLNRPDMVLDYSRKLVETNPYVSGCSIAFKPNYYQNHEYFMAHSYRGEGDEASVIQSESSDNRSYTAQEWYTKSMASVKPGWLRSDVDADKDLITFCLPIPGADGQPIGVMGVDVLLSQLSHIVETAKPSPNSYCTLLDHEGSFIVHPDSNKLYHQTVFTQLEKGADPSVKEAAQAMVSGETGYRPFRMNGSDYYVFYKPFKRAAIPGRSIEELGWSAGIIYPEDDIFGDYNSLLYYVLAIAFVGLLLLFLLSRTIFHRQLKPLLMLAASAQRIAKGNYDETIPFSRHKDEIGRLQDNFSLMQQSLATNIGELEQLKIELQERGEGLRVAYNQAQKADRMKTAFLHNMTNQMIAPADAIDKDVEALLSDSRNRGELVNDIQLKSKSITELLNDLISISDEERLHKEQKGGGV